MITPPTTDPAPQTAFPHSDIRVPTSAFAPFLRLSRTYFTHYFWEEPRKYSRAEAWLDLVRTAAYQPTTRLVKGIPVHLQRGSLIASIRYLSTRWSWSNTKICQYLQILQAEQMITTEKRHGTTIITLTNYDTFNPPSPEKNDQETPPKRRRTPRSASPMVGAVDPNSPPLSVSPTPSIPPSHSEPPPQNSPLASDLRLPTSDLANPPAPVSTTPTPAEIAPSPHSAFQVPRSAFAPSARPSSMQEVAAYCQSLGLPATDGEYLWETWQAGGWTRGGHPIKDWQASARSWKVGHYLPSQKQTAKRTPKTPGPITALHDPTGTIASQY